MTLKSLGDGLRDLADAVETVDLRDRALAASSRLRARRVATGVAGAVAAVLIAFVGFNAVGTDRAGPEGGPTAEQPSGPPLLPEPSPVEESVVELTGTFYYLKPDYVPRGEDGMSADTQDLLSWREGGTPRTVVEDMPLTPTANVSPDGRYLSYVSGGRLVIRDLASGRQWPIMEYSDEQLCAVPVWAPDARRLFVHRGAPGEGGPAGFYDITTGTFTQVGDVPGCHVRVGADETGRDLLTYTAYGTDDQTTVVRGADDAEPDAVVDWNVLPGRWIYQPFSVSADADMMCVDTIEEAAFPADSSDLRSDFCTTILRLETKERGRPDVVEVDVDGAGLQQALMFADSFVARVFSDDGGTELRLLSPDGAELDELSEPMWEEEPTLLAYVP
ncbi:hypothetical protein AB0I28_28935 [Phytomonospora sp. NPDC050363]|uniref:hypothetical protein n=1 Tax=Phytomonospora sp. NPDC050363 TaxID=3155642 RepID=UPI0033FA1E7E